MDGDCVNSRIRDRVLSALSNKNLSCRKFAKEMGVSCAAVSRWLSGQRRPSLRNAMKMSQFLGIPLEVWFEE